jgi:hypothetical protein
MAANEDEQVMMVRFDFGEVAQAAATSWLRLLRKQPKDELTNPQFRSVLLIMGFALIADAVGVENVAAAVSQFQEAGIVFHYVD